MSYPHQFLLQKTGMKVLPCTSTTIFCFWSLREVMLVSGIGLYTMNKKHNNCYFFVLFFLLILHYFVRQRLLSGELCYSSRPGEECDLMEGMHTKSHTNGNCYKNAIRAFLTKTVHLCSLLLYGDTKYGWAVQSTHPSATSPGILSSRYLLPAQDWVGMKIVPMTFPGKTVAKCTLMLTTERSI